MKIKAVSEIMVTLLLAIMMTTPFVRVEGIYWYDSVFIEPEVVEVYVGEYVGIAVSFGYGFESDHPFVIEFSLCWDPSMLEFVDWESLWDSPTVVVGDDYMRVMLNNPGVSTPLIGIVFKAKAVGSTILDLFDSNVDTVDGYVDILRTYPIILTVDDDGPADFHSIQEAIKKSSRGDTIYVKAGTYYEHVLVKKPLSLIGEDKEVTIIDGNGTGTVVKVTANYVNITGFTIRNSGSGYMDSGIFLKNSAMSNISGNIITQNTGSTVHGMLLQYSEGNVISGNKISYNGWGIELQYYSNNNFIYGNTIVNNSVGIVLYLSGGNKLRNNTINNNLHNFGVYASYINDIDTSNTVNGKPIYYLINQKNLIINALTFPDVGYLGIINSTNITVENLNLTNNFQGLLFAHTHNSTIKNVSSSENDWGIDLGASNGNFISENIITNNWNGIAIFDSSGNSIKDNTITKNQWGIWSIRSSGNNLSENTIASNNYGGIFLGDSNYNLIYHNNFINSKGQAALYDSNNNTWDNGYPSGGNYWSDYTGVDVKSGPNQDQPSSDGIGDTPYPIDADNEDRYPLMGPVNAFDAGTWNNIAYYVNVASNSTVSGFYFNPEVGAFIRFNVTGPDGTTGFCRVVIPKELLWVEDGQWTILVGGEPVEYVVIPDENCTYICFTYSHTTKTVEIIGTNVVPEFPTWTPILLILILLSIAIAIHKRRLLKIPIH